MAINDLRGVRVGFNQVADLIENGEIITDLTEATPASGDYVLFADVSDSNNGKKGLISALADTIATYKNITSTTYTPTLTNSTNVAASTAYQCWFIRIGNFVEVSGRLDITATAATGTQLYISLPVASNFTNAEQLAGVGASSNTQVLRIVSDATGDRAQVNYNATTTSSTPFFFKFSYRII